MYRATVSPGIQKLVDAIPPEDLRRMARTGGVRRPAEGLMELEMAMMRQGRLQRSQQYTVDGASPMLAPGSSMRERHPMNRFEPGVTAASNWGVNRDGHQLPKLQHASSHMSSPGSLADDSCDVQLAWHMYRATVSPGIQKLVDAMPHEDLRRMARTGGVRRPAEGLMELEMAMMRQGRLRCAFARTCRVCKGATGVCRHRGEPGHLPIDPNAVTDVPTNLLCAGRSTSSKFRKKNRVRLPVGTRIEYKFEVEGSHRWYAGTVEGNSPVRCSADWFHVKFDDEGCTLAVKIDAVSEGNVWRMAVGAAAQTPQRIENISRSVTTEFTDALKHHEAKHVSQTTNANEHGKCWSSEDDRRLLSLVKSQTAEGWTGWARIASEYGKGRTPISCKSRYKYIYKKGIYGSENDPATIVRHRRSAIDVQTVRQDRMRGPTEKRKCNWSTADDVRLLATVELQKRQARTSWVCVATTLGNGRSANACRRRHERILNTGAESCPKREHTNGKRKRVPTEISFDYRIREPKYHGTSWLMPPISMWKAAFGKTHTNLGRFVHEKDAARAYDDHVRSLHKNKRRKRYNFPKPGERGFRNHDSSERKKRQRGTSGEERTDPIWTTEKEALLRRAMKYGPPSWDDRAKLIGVSVNSVRNKWQRMCRKSACPANLETSSANAQTSEGAVTEVERILDKRITKIRNSRRSADVSDPSFLIEYEVKWKDYSQEDNTWMPKADLTGCSKLIAEYEKSVAAYGTESLRTSIFASERVERLMRLRTWQAQPKSKSTHAPKYRYTWQGTDEPLLDSIEMTKPHALPIFTAATNSVRGIGAYASRSLAPGAFVGEYAGEIVLDDETEGTDRERSEYLFGLGDGFSVDAQRMGNKTRRINHGTGSMANVSSQVVNHHGVRKVVMRAKSRIQSGEELRFDYGKDARWRSKLV
eukprot:SAG31_NODE_1612_length_7743_cov_6.653323_2_plen_928_part_00